MPRQTSLILAAAGVGGFLLTSLACAGLDMGDLIARSEIEGAAEAIVEVDDGPHAVTALAALDRAYAAAVKSSLDGDSDAILRAAEQAAEDGTITEEEAAAIAALCPTDPVPADVQDTVEGYHDTVTRRIGRERGDFSGWSRDDMIAAIERAGFEVDPDSPCNDDAEDPKCYGWSDEDSLRLFHFDYGDKGDARTGLKQDLFIGEVGRRDGGVVLTARYAKSEVSSLVAKKLGLTIQTDVTALDEATLGKKLGEAAFKEVICESEAVDGRTEVSCEGRNGGLETRVQCAAFTGVEEPEVMVNLGSWSLYNGTGNCEVEGFDMKATDALLDRLVGAPTWPSDG